MHLSWPPGTNPPMSLASQIRKSLEDNWVTRFHTNHPDGDDLDGVVIQIQREFIVLREDGDLRFDGVLVVPRRVLTGCRDGAVEKCWNAIHRHLGDLSEASSPEWMGSCKTMADILRELQGRDIWPGVEILFEGDDGRDSAFYVGPVVRVDDDEFLLHCYDAEGAWEEVYEIGLDEVFKITFGDSYTSRFNDFMRSRGPDRPL